MITKSLKPLILSILILSIALIIAQFFRDELVFHRSAIDDGQWWLIISGNFVHSNYPHLLINLAGLWLFGFVFLDHFSMKVFSLSTVVLSFFVGSGLYFFDLELQRYFGFSGILYGLFLVGATFSILGKDYFTGITISIFIIGKIIWDLRYGGSTSSAELIGIPVAINAHLYGVIGAIAISIALFIFRTREK